MITPSIKDWELTLDAKHAGQAELQTPRHLALPTSTAMKETIPSSASSRNTLFHNSYSSGRCSSSACACERRFLLGSSEQWMCQRR